MPGTKKLVARYGERLVCARYLYDEARNRRLKTVELVVEEAPRRGRARRPRRNDHDLVGVRIAWSESELRSAVKRAGAIWRPRQKLWEMSWEAVRTLSWPGAVCHHRALDLGNSSGRVPYRARGYHSHYFGS